MQGYVTDKPKYEAEFADAPEFYLQKDDEILKVEKDKDFSKILMLTRKRPKAF